MASRDANNRFNTEWILPLFMRRSLGFVVLALAVIALPWLVVSVAANLQAYPTPVGIHVNPTCFGPCNSNSTFSSALIIAGQADPGAFRLALAAIVLGCLGLSYLAWRRGLRSGKSDNLWNIPALLLLIGMFYLALTVAPRVGTYLQPGPGTAQSPLPLWYLSLALVVVAGGVSLTWALRRAGGITIIPSPTTAESGRKESLAGVLQGALGSLRAGNDPRSIIINCYRSMVDLLQEAGVSDSPSMTAREFEATCQRLFAVKRELIHRLTALFERARYSDEDIGTLQASEAEEVLTELRDSATGSMMK